MAKISSSTVRLSVPDGTSLNTYIAYPKERMPNQGIIVFQEAFGVNAHIKDITERFAREGFFAVAPELFHRTAEGFEGDYTDFEKSRPHMQALTNAGLEADIRATYDWLQKEVHLEVIHAIGFCMGGRAAYLANSILPLASAVSFYGGGIVDLLDRASRLHGPMLCFYGGKDKHIDASQRNTITAALDMAKKPYINTVFSSADHGFFCDARASYHAKSARLAWPLTLGFLKEKWSITTP